MMEAPGAATVVADSTVVPDASSFVSAIGVAYGSGPTIVYPAASCALTLTGIDAGVPAVTVAVASATITFATTPANATLTVFVCPATMAAVVEPLDSRCPVPPVAAIVAGQTNTVKVAFAGVV